MAFWVGLAVVLGVSFVGFLLIMTVAVLGGLWIRRRANERRANQPWPPREQWPPR
ncbi:hypothetical protein [Saccharopolyspora sp. 5N708]|uniref:hypothetical protein n=1 Tax=Saccharopolyspora sp. 5N708 TaxID=3457424 RepID=UPI003FD45F16